MADEELTEQEIEQREKLIEVLMEQARTGEKGIDAQIKLYLENTKFGKSLAETTKAANKVTSGFKESAKAMGTGTGNLTDLSGAVTGTIDAISGLLGNIPILGKGFEAMGAMASEIATFGIGQIQANYDSFKELAKAGTIGAEGVTGMADQFMKAGLPLQTYSKLLTENSENLAYFSGTALQGGKDFSKLIGNMDTETKQYMRNLGYGIDEISESAIEWQVLQRQRGIRQQLSDAELTRGTANYVSELDALSKLTGQNVKELKAQRDQVRSDSRFRARLMKLNNEGNTEGAKNMELFAAIMKKAAPEIGQGFSDITSGAINTEAAMKLTRSGMLDAAQAVQKGLEAGTMTQSEALERMRDAAKESSEVGGAMQGLAGFIENGQSPFLDLAQTANFGNKAIGDMTKLIEEQNKVRAAPDTATDKLSSTMASIEQTMANVNQLFIATPAATKGLAAFAEGLDVVIQKVSDWANADGSGGGTGMVDGRPKSTSMTTEEMNASKAATAKRATDTKKNNIENILANLKSQGKTQAEIDEAMAPIYKAYGMKAPAGTAPTSAPAPALAAPKASTPTATVDYGSQIHDLKGAMGHASRDMMLTEAAARKDGVISSSEKAELTKIANGIVAMEKRMAELRDLAKQQRDTAKAQLQVTKTQ